MLFGTPVWLDKLLEMMERQIVVGTKLPADRVFSTLARDEDHLAFPPHDEFVTVTPQNFPAGGPGVTGGGRLNTGFDGRVRVALFARYAVDQELRAGKLLQDRTRGILARWRLVLSSLQQWTPLHTDGTCYLREPARVEAFDVSPKAMKAGSPWAVLGSTWSVRFTSDIPASVPT